MKSSIETILRAIFHTIGILNKGDQKFWIKLFEVLLHMRGRKNYTNIARFGSFGENTLRRRFGRPIDWLSFNLCLLDSKANSQSPLIGAIDCSFLHKSGNKTYGLDKFWSSVAGKTIRGLEISLAGVIEVLGPRVWAIDVQQTPAGLSNTDNAQHNRLDFYLAQLCRCVLRLPQVLYWVGDSFYAKSKVFQSLESQGRFFITQLRNDANLRYIKALETPGKPGRKPKWGEKVVFTDLSRWDNLGRDFKLPHLRLYAQELYSPAFDRVLKVVLVQNTKTGKHLLLASSNPTQEPRQIVAYYQLRFHLEFFFRDAKQFGGLEHAQTRQKENLHNHFNLSMTSINLMNALQVTLPNMTSKNSLIRVAFNTNLIHLVIQKLGLKPEFVNSKTKLDSLYYYGALAA
jgi:hypothetical protein